MSNENWMIQDTIQGLDEGGRTRMLNVRGASVAEFLEELKTLEPHFTRWKPLPIKQFGGGGAGKPVAKEIKGWADVPRCPKHGEIAYPNAWKDHPGKFFWNCSECQKFPFEEREKIGFATQEQFDAFGRLDPDERPSNPATEHKPAKALVSLAMQLGVARKELRALDPSVPILKPEDWDTEAKCAALLAVTRKRVNELKGA